VLAFEPDCEDAMHFALALGEWADNNNLLVVALMDRTLMHVKAVSPQIQEYRERFFAQFRSAGIYYPPPNTTFIATMMKVCVEEFARHYAHTHPVTDEHLYPQLSVDLTEDNYVVLADLAKCAATGQVLQYLKAVFYEMFSMHPPCKAEDGVLHLNMNIMSSPPFITNANGFPHIIHYGLKEHCASEDFYCQEGRGTPSAYGSEAMAAYVSSSTSNVVTANASAPRKKPKLNEPEAFTPTSPKAGDEWCAVAEEK